jgi:hypothetical protein
MTRFMLTGVLAVAFLELDPYDAANSARAQDVTCNVDIQNGNDFPIRIKRVGMENGDQADVEVAPNTTVSIEDVPFRSDQVFMAWSLDGNARCVGSRSIDVATATRNHVTLSVRGGQMAPQLKPKGAGGNTRPKGDPNGGNDTFARNLGIYYQPDRFNDGTFGARITRPPDAGTPAAQLGFEIGDIITALDGQPFRTPEDVLNHTQETTVDFIDTRTKERRRATVILP